MTHHLTIKAQITAEPTGEISGVAWPYGTADRVGDVIEPGAFKAATPMPMLFAHDQGEVVGVWNEITETPEGLTVKGKLLIEDVARAREVHALIRAGAVSGLSVGFATKKAQPRQNGGRTITAAELHEVSVVAIPCHPDAQITTLKAEGGAALTIEYGDSRLMENQTQTEPNAQPVPVLDTKALDAVQARLDALEAKAQRPGAAQTPVEGAERKAFTEYLRNGTADTKALTFASDTTNHVLAPEDVAGEFLRNLVEFSPIRQIADVRSTGSNTIILPKRTGITNAKWVGETETRTGSQPGFGQMSLPVYELATFVDLSLQLAEDSQNVLSEVTLALSEDFGQKEALAFVKGGTFTAPATGPKDPEGFMTAAGVATTKNGHAANLSADALIALMYALPATYRNAGSWVMNGGTLAAIRKLKDGHGNYLWQPSYQAGQPETILGRPVIEAVDMPDIAADAEPVIFGDFKRGFRIYDRLDLSILVDPYSVRIDGLVRYHARHRVGAGVVRSDAFRKLSMKV